MKEGATLAQAPVNKPDEDKRGGVEDACPGDGNLDKRVDQHDLRGTHDFAGVGPSFFDFNGDAKTDQADSDIVTAH